MSALHPFLSGTRRSSLFLLTSLFVPLFACSVYDESLLPDQPGNTATGGLPGTGGAFDTGGTGGTDPNIGGTGNMDAGGAGGTGGTSTACEPSGSSGPREYVLISDTETDQINLPGGGYWFSAAAMSSCLTDTLPAALETPRERDDEQGGGESEYAMHIIGEECSGWGANAGFRLQQAGAYNACEFDGIAFWARLGNPDSEATLQVEIPDVNTDPAGGVCDPMDGTADSCHSYHFMDVTLTNDWELYEVPFSEVAQPNWGYRAGDLSRGELFQIQFKWPGDTPSFEVWIDDVYFYKGDAD